jgi:hypothetical protein
VLQRKAREPISYTFQASEYPAIDLNDSKEVIEFMHVLSETGDFQTLGKLNKQIKSIRTSQEFDKRVE